MKTQPFDCKFDKLFKSFGNFYYKNTSQKAQNIRSTEENLKSKCVTSAR